MIKQAVGPISRCFDTRGYGSRVARSLSSGAHSRDPLACPGRPENQTRHDLPAALLRPSRALSPSLESRGRRECRGDQTHPQPRVRKEKAHELVTTGAPNDPAFPARMVLTVSFVLARRPGLVVSVPGATLTRRHQVDISVGYQAHTTSPSAPGRVRLRAASVHRIPLPTSVTIAKRPSCGGGTRGKMLLICPTPQANASATDLPDEAGQELAVRLVAGSMVRPEACGMSKSRLKRSG